MLCLSLSVSFTRLSVVEKCKRRWRMIRSDYTRWLNQAEQRSKSPKRSAYYLSDALKFLNPHLSVADSGSALEHDQYERESSERERDSKSRSKEPPILEESYKGKPKETTESVEEKSQPDKELNQADKKQSEEKKLEEKKSEDKKLKKESGSTKSSEETTETPTSASEQPSNPTQPGGSSKKLEFFIKQSNLSSPNCLIIGKKETLSETPPPDPLEAMAGDDSPDETASVGGGRRLRRSASRLKQLPIQKPLAADQRQTRLQRRKSMTVAAAHSLRSSTSPVKMTPLPRTSAGLAAATAATTTTTTVSAGGAQSNQSPSVVTSKASSVVAAAAGTATAGAGAGAQANRDDIFPRPQATAPLAQQPVLARRPGVPAQQTQPSPPVRHHIGTVRPPAQARITTANHTSPAAAKRAAPQIGARHVAPSVASSIAAVAAAAQSRINSSSSSISSGVSSGSGSSSVGNSSAPLASASSSSSAVAAAASSAKQLCERGSQTEAQDIFSDEHFLDMVRPQMREMNPRQKLHFKQKIFQALMETFDDATDFPGEGEVQHFNINTPSGFEHVSDPELRLVRELVSMVSAAKHTEKVLVQPGQGQGQGGQQRSPAGTQAAAAGAATAATAGSAQRAVATTGKMQNQVRIQRPSAVVPAAVIGDDKKLYRILQMNNNAKIRAMAALRKDSIDSNGSLGNMVPTRPGTFVVPASSPKTPATPNTASPLQSQTLRIQDPLLSLFGAGQVSGKAASSKDPLQVRQMGRRYSVCGAGGPVTNLGAAAAGNLASGSTVSPAYAAAVAENMQLKRRMAPASQATVPPQQRARYSHSPVAGSQLAAIAPGNSLLVRRAAAGAQKQLSPTGGGSVPQKTPQMQGGSGSGSGSGFGTPTALRGSNSSLNNVGLAQGGSGTSPLKRGMVIANVKGAAQQQKQSPSSTSSSSSSTSLAAMKQAPASTNNVANLLADGRPTPQASQGYVTPARPGARKVSGESETAGIIAADDFDMSRLKREPQEYVDDDILGN